MCIICVVRPVPIPAPLVVEEPPSSDNDNAALSSDEDNTLSRNIDPVLLNG